MILTRRRLLVFAAALLVSLSGVALVGPRIAVAADSLPKQLSDRAFWAMVVDFSEAEGTFRSENLISNERTFQEVIPELKTHVTPGGVYLGVGPDQNFTYIASLRPRMAFIVDIRRQNMMQHLLYKAIAEMSDGRADFLSRLFARPRPAGLARSAAPQTLLDAFAMVPADETVFQKNFEAIMNRLVTRHGFALTAEDRRGIEYIARAFFAEGPALTYAYPRQQVSARMFPSYAELMTATDLAGLNRSYVANEESFRTLRDLERNNLLVPIVGDFAGDKAVRAVGRYIRERGATVNFFYTSNVEQYLFQGDLFQRFYSNVATLPVDGHSTFIRSFFDRGFRYPPGITTADLHSVQLLDPIADSVGAFQAGQIRTYENLVERSK